MSGFTETGFPKRGWKGMGASFDVGEGNYLQKEKDKPLRQVFLNYQKRFCETCKQHKVRGKRKAVKGWKCDDCFECKDKNGSVNA